MSSMDIGIDLGTANIIITMGDKIVVDEPTVVAYNKKKKEVVAVGKEAYKMIGRTPEYIVAVRPLKDGVISDRDMTMLMLKEFIKKASKNLMLKPKIIICVPSSVTDVENRAVADTALSSGARKVYLIKEPIAALMGAGVDITKPTGTMVVDIGGGTADIAVISFNGIVNAISVKVAGNKFDQAIIKHVLQNHKILIGEKTAESAKKTVGSVFNPNPDASMIIKGRNVIKGLPQSLEITQVDMCDALKDSAMEIVNKIKSVLEVTPPELVGDILVSGIVLTGGGAMLRGLDKLVAERTGAPCRLADNPIECVARGVATAFKYEDSLLDGFEKISMYRYNK